MLVEEGKIVDGKVSGITNFGAFIQLPEGKTGLVHISEMSDKYVKNPMDVVSVGDIVKVRVIKVDQEKHKVSLSMKNV